MNKLNYFLLLLTIQIFSFSILSCTKDQEKNEISNQSTETRTGDWKFAYTFQGIGKKCVAPPKDCGAFKVGDEALPYQSDLDNDLTKIGVKNFFLSNNSSKLFSGLNGITLTRLNQAITVSI